MVLENAAKSEDVTEHSYEGNEAEQYPSGLSQLTEGFGTPGFKISLWEDDIDDPEEGIGVDYYSQELALLTECLFSTISTVEMVILATIAAQKQKPGLDEREMILSKSQSEISLSTMPAGPVKELLEVDLELVAAMRESLKDTKYAKYLEHESPNFDAKRMDEDLHEACRQMKYWTGKLQEDGQSMTTDTNTAVAVHLARIANTFSSSFMPVKPRKDLDREKIQSLIQQCLARFPEASGPSTVETPSKAISAISKVSTSRALDFLKESNLELRSLAGSKAPQTPYLRDFELPYPQDGKDPAEKKVISSD